MKLTALIGLVALVAGVRAAPIVWEVSEGGNGHSYDAVLVPGSITWHDAQAQAESMGGHLVTLTSQAENDWVFANFVSDLTYWVLPGTGPWLGLYQDLNDPSYSEPAGGWKWVTGEPVSFLAWAINQPNNSGSDQHHAHYYERESSPPDFTWQDIRFDAPVIAYIVEFEPPQILSHPATQIVQLGDLVQFTVWLSDSSGVAYQWYKNGEPLADSAGVTGSQTSSLAVLADRNGVAQYHVVVTRGGLTEVSTPAVLAIELSCPGDIDHSGFVDVFDFSEFVANFGQTCSE